MALLRALLPSWRFFVEYANPNELFFRLGEAGEWKALFPPPPPRRFWNLVWNPRGNLRLAYGAAIDRLIDEAADAATGTSLARTVSYRIVERIARFELLRAHRVPPGTPFRFLVREREESGTTRDLFLSGEART